MNFSLTSVEETSSGPIIAANGISIKDAELVSSATTLGAVVENCVMNV
jgi:hypothetical protein